LSSRSENDLHPVIREQFRQARAKYATTYPDLPQPFLTCVHRSNIEQDALYLLGRTQPCKIVTHAKGGESLHNYLPSCAFDLAFKIGKSVYWDQNLFQKFADIAVEFNLEWGGGWKNFKDSPHFQAPGYTWQDAKAGKEPQ